MSDVHPDGVSGEWIARSSPEPAEPLLSADDVCAWLNVAKHWVYDEVEARRLPHVRLGRRTLRFRRADIEAYLRGRTHDGTGAVAQPAGEVRSSTDLEPLEP